MHPMVYGFGKSNLTDFYGQVGIFEGLHSHEKLRGLWNFSYPFYWHFWPAFDLDFIVFDGLL